MRHVFVLGAVVLNAVVLAGCAPDGTAPAGPPIPAASDVATAAAAEPTLLARAILPANAYQAGPPSGALATPDNGAVPPFPGQPIPGFSAILDAGGGTFLAMPDNGYGTKGNSGDFLLRLYRIRPEFRTAQGGSGAVAVLGFVQLSDPDGRVPFPLGRADRLLTGADFDLESVRREGNGDLWFGEEFGPFILHTDASGRVLEAPFPLPGVQSPQNPYLASADAWTLPGSRGFEGMALAADGATLYPILEGALRADADPRRRIVHEFDLRARAYTGRTWQYRTDAAFPGAVIGDFTAVDAHRFVLIERDDAQGAEARQKKIYLVDLRRTDADGFLEKRLVLDLLGIGDPDGVSLPARSGEFGVGDPFAFPLQSVESLEVLGGERLLIANDNNYPGSDGRWVGRDRPDDTELIVVRAPALVADGGGNSAPTVEGLRADPAAGPYRVGARACGGRATVCLRFAVADADGATDAPFQVVVNWGDRTTWAANTVQAAGTPLLVPHDYAAAGTYAVRVTVTDRRGAATSTGTTLVVVP
jgi:hypothetical protein